MTEQWWPPIEDRPVSETPDQTWPDDGEENPFLVMIKGVHQILEDFAAKVKTHKRAHISLGKQMAKAGYHVLYSEDDTVCAIDLVGPSVDENDRLPRKMKKARDRMPVVKKGGTGPVRTPFKNRGRG